MRVARAVPVRPGGRVAPRAARCVAMRCAATRSRPKPPDLPPIPPTAPEHLVPAVPAAPAPGPAAPALAPCAGCGAVLQSESERRLGYLPPALLAAHESTLPAALEGSDLHSILAALPRSASQAGVVCQRCWRLRHYGEVVPVTVTVEEFHAELEAVSAQEALMVLVVDLFDVEGGFLPQLRRLVGRNPVLLVGHKCDLLPRGVPPARVLQWLRAAARARQLHPAAVLLASARTGAGMHELAAALQRARDGRNAVVLGRSNAGKSSLINRLVRTLRSDGAPVQWQPALPTVSAVPGTTLSTLGLAMPGGWTLFDTPGVMATDGLQAHLPTKEFMDLQPTRKLQPSTFRLLPGQALALGTYAAVEYVSGPDLAHFTAFTAPSLPLAKVPAGAHPGLEPAPVRRVAGDSFTRPAADVVLPGLGWVALAARGDVVWRSWARPACPALVRPPLVLHAHGRGRTHEPAPAEDFSLDQITFVS